MQMDLKEKKYDSDGFSEEESDNMSADDYFYSKAVLCIRKNSAKLAKDKLLYFYARFKFINDGPCAVSRPGGIFNFEAKSKWDAWNALNAELPQLTVQEAKRQYCLKLDEAMPSWREGVEQANKFNEANESGTFGIRMSQMTSADQIDDSDKTCFDFCKEHNLEKLKACLDKSKAGSIDQTDENQMTLLMWACDRGYMDIVEFLVASQADLNKQDADGQTCLHYAVSCEHLNLIKYLLSLKNLNIDLADNENQKPVDLTQNKEILACFNQKI